MHRTVPGALIQFGIHGDPAVNYAWFRETLADDPRRQRNRRGFVALASAGPDTRRSELLINLRDNAELDAQGIVPLGRVVRGMSVLDGIAPAGRPPTVGPLKRYVLTMGEPYMARYFPKSPKIKHVAFTR